MYTCMILNHGTNEQYSDEIFVLMYLNNSLI